MPANKALAFCSEKNYFTTCHWQRFQEKNKKLKGIIHIHFLLKNEVK